MHFYGFTCLIDNIINLKKMSKHRISNLYTLTKQIKQSTGNFSEKSGDKTNLSCNNKPMPMAYSNPKWIWICIIHNTLCFHRMEKQFRSEFLTLYGWLLHVGLTYVKL